jgi:hypothetical protein
VGVEKEFAGRHKSFLVETHPKMYVELLNKGELDAYLDKIGLQAKELMETIVARKKPELDRIENEEERLTRLAQIEMAAEETALHEIVLAPLR